MGQGEPFLGLLKSSRLQASVTLTHRAGTHHLRET